jgi:hypothetical protein
MFLTFLFKKHLKKLKCSFLAPIAAEILFLFQEKIIAESGTGYL